MCVCTMCARICMCMCVRCVCVHACACLVCDMHVCARVCACMWSCLALRLRTPGTISRPPSRRAEPAGPHLGWRAGAGARPRAESSAPTSSPRSPWRRRAGRGRSRASSPARPSEAEPGRSGRGNGALQELKQDAQKARCWRREGVALRNGNLRTCLQEKGGWAAGEGR